MIDNQNQKSSIWFVYTMAFLRTIAGSAIGLIVPLYLRLQGVGDFITSIVASGYALTYIFSPLLLGRISDRIGRRKAITISALLAFVDTCMYLIFWNLLGPLILGVIIGIFFATRLSDGIWNGAYWATLQSRISDEKHTMEEPEKYEKHIRIYNLGWNAGIVVGNILITLASIPTDPKAVLDNLFIVLLISTIILIVNAIVGFTKFQDSHGFHAHPSGPEGPVLNPELERVPQNYANFMEDYETNNKEKDHRLFTRGEILHKLIVAYLVIFGFGFTLSLVVMNVTNHFTEVVRAGTPLTFNLLLFIPICNGLRTITQGVGSSIIKIPDRPAKRFPLLAIPMVVLIAMGITTYLVPTMQGASLLVFLGLLSILGLFFGHLYSLALARVINTCENRDTGFYTGLFEAMIGLAFFLGQMTSGAVTEFLPYYMPYFITAIILAIILLVILFRRESQ